MLLIGRSHPGSRWEGGGGEGLSLLFIFLKTCTCMSIHVGPTGRPLSIQNLHKYFEKATMACTDYTIAPKCLTRYHSEDTVSGAKKCTFMLHVIICSFFFFTLTFLRNKTLGSSSRDFTRTRLLTCFARWVGYRQSDVDIVQWSEDPENKDRSYVTRSTTVPEISICISLVM